MIFASNNQGKIREIKSIFNNEEIRSLKEANVDIDVKNTIINNYESAKAIKKSLEQNNNLGVNPLLFEMLY